MTQTEELRVQRNIPIRKSRRMPTQGEVLVKIGDQVGPETIVARGTVINPEVREVIVYTKLGIDTTEVDRYLLKKKGDQVEKDEIIAARRSFFGRSKVCRSPMDGTIEALSGSSGSLLIRGKPIPIEVKAHIPGKIVEIVAGEGAVVECKGNILLGRFGIGGETVGELAVAVDRANEALTTELISKEYGGKIVVGGSFAGIDALQRATSVGVKGIVVGGVDEKDLTEFLGHEIGIGVTGKEKTGLTAILTEGFGAHAMDEEMFGLFKSSEGKQVSIDGSTQIRTRMLRPEIIIPL